METLLVIHNWFKNTQKSDSNLYKYHHKNIFSTMCELWPHLNVPRGQKIF